MLLNVHSHYSLRYGTMGLNDLVKSMADNGYDTAVLTDINNSSAVLSFIKLCRKYGLNGLAGMEFRNGDTMLYTGIAAGTSGFRELNVLMTNANKHKTLLPELPPLLDDVFMIYPYGKKKISELREREYIGISIQQLNKIRLEPRSNRDHYVLFQPLSFSDEQELVRHTRLQAIDHNLLISQLQPGQTGQADEIWLSRKELLQAYRDFPELIRNTEQLLASCSFDFDFDEVRHKKHFTGSYDEDKALLYTKAMEGLERRYGNDHTTARERIWKELDIIDIKKFAAYFLITDDICRYARSHGFHYVGRGSGANSIVAYCLGITDVCPMELDLYFERFLNPKRMTPPDFDIDFCWNERDGIYEYIFSRYPEGHVALMGAMSTFQSRSIRRELGKIYGLPKAEIDRLVHDPRHILNKNEVTELILSVCDEVLEVPNQRTIHASGVLISEYPITSYCALDYPQKGWPVTQFDMHAAEEICLEKFDILSQRGIGHIRDCVQLVQENRQEQADVSQPRRFFNDPAITARLRKADTVGCFYIESPAMRQLLAKLNCDNYLTLVAASSIIRPGVASSGMMKAYIERHHNPDAVAYLHPVFKEQLKETYGVMVYQEDVMKVGHYYGGLDLADADVLRRMMSGKSRTPELLKEIGLKFFANCRDKGYPEAVSQEIWRQMESFAGFSFNKAHSASFAVESYQSLYLKTNYPVEFMVSVLNNYGGFYQRKVYVNETRKAGGVILLPCVNHSRYTTSLYGLSVYLGFDGLQHLEGQLAQQIAPERQRNGPYATLEDFVRRTGAGLEQLLVLIRCGAFRFTGAGKKELLWEAHLLLNGRQDIRNISTLFEHRTDRPALPVLETSVLEDLYDEIELMGFPVSDTMFSLARSDYRGDVTAEQLAEKEGQVVRIVGDFVCDKQVSTRNGQSMKFGTFLDVNGALFDTIHFPPSLKNYPVYGNGLYLIQGRVALDFGCPAIEVDKLGRMPLKADPRSE